MIEAFFGGIMGALLGYVLSEAHRHYKAYKYGKELGKILEKMQKEGKIKVSTDHDKPNDTIN